MRDGGSWSGGLMASASLKSLFQETGLGFMWFWGLWFLFEENNKTNKQKWRRLCWEGKPKCQRQSHGGIPRFGGGSAEAGAWGGWRSESQGWCWKGPLVVVRGVERHGCAVPPPKQHPPTPPITKQPLCLSTMRSVEQSLYIDDVMMESGEEGGWSSTQGHIRRRFKCVGGVYKYPLRGMNITWALAEIFPPLCCPCARTNTRTLCLRDYACPSSVCRAPPGGQRWALSVSSLRKG